MMKVLQTRIPISNIRWRQLVGTFSKYCVDTVSMSKLMSYSCYLYSENVSVTVFPVRALRDVQLARLLGDAEQPIGDQYCSSHPPITAHLNRP